MQGLTLLFYGGLWRWVGEWLEAEHVTEGQAHVAAEAWPVYSLADGGWR